MNLDDVLAEAQVVKKPESDDDDETDECLEADLTDAMELLEDCEDLLSRIFVLNRLDDVLQKELLHQASEVRVFLSQYELTEDEREALFT